MIAMPRGQAVAGRGYLPTPAEIQRACEEIQATWSRKERRRRDLERRFARWTPPTVALPDLLPAVSEEWADGTP